MHDDYLTYHPDATCPRYPRVNFLFQNDDRVGVCVCVCVCARASRSVHMAVSQHATRAYVLKRGNNSFLLISLSLSVSGCFAEGGLARSQKRKKKKSINMSDSCGTDLQLCVRVRAHMCVCVCVCVCVCRGRLLAGSSRQRVMWSDPLSPERERGRSCVSLFFFFFFFFFFLLLVFFSWSSFFIRGRKNTHTHQQRERLI